MDEKREERCTRKDAVIYPSLIRLKSSGTIQSSILEWEQNE